MSKKQNQKKKGLKNERNCMPCTECNEENDVCMICQSEISLYPCIELQCKHICHAQCAIKKLTVEYRNDISFQFRNCICGQVILILLCFFIFFFCVFLLAICDLISMSIFGGMNVKNHIICQ